MDQSSELFYGSDKAGYDFGALAIRVVHQGMADGAEFKQIVVLTHSFASTD